MTDTVNVPCEMTPEMHYAADRVLANAVGRGGSIFETTQKMWSAMLAAAPKAEPVSGSIVEMVSELVNETAPDQAETPSRAFALALSLQAALASQPAVPKVEQEPVAWQRKAHGGKGWIYIGPENVDIGYETRPLYTHPAPASDELLEALKPFADAAEDLDEAETGNIWERPSAMSIDASDLRRAAKLYAKHKGPQS